MRVQFDRPNGWEMEIVAMDGAVYLRCRAPGSTLPWQYVLSHSEAMQAAQMMEEQAIAARHWHEADTRHHVAAAAPYDGAA